VSVMVPFGTLVVRRDIQDMMMHTGCNQATCTCRLSYFLSLVQDAIEMEQQLLVCPPIGQASKDPHPLLLFGESQSITS
jgi:hypothetical protein